MLGQNHHFTQYAPEQVPYAIERYLKETERLYGVLDERLAGNEFVAGDFSIADMAIYPWAVPHQKQGQNLDEYPHVRRWFEAIGSREAVQRAYARGEEFSGPPPTDDKARAILFGQGRRK
jgi:GST-like protein